MTAPRAFEGRDFFGQVIVGVQAPDVTVTRPANAVAYAAGQVWGTAVDGRFTLPVPPLPPLAFTPGFTGLQLIMINSRPPSDPTFINWNIVMSLNGFATVLADQAALNLSDPDIAGILPSNVAGLFSQSTVITTGVAFTGGLNQSAGIAGRRAAVTAIGFNAVNLFPTPGANFQVYLVATAAYAPVASEFVTLRPVWTVTQRVLI